MCYRRQAVLIPNGKKHLHFVVTDPVNEKVLLIGITSSVLEPKFTLERGDHPFIGHTSYINYKQAVRYKVDVVKRCLKNGVWERQPDAREKIIQKVCEGILESDHTTPEVEGFFESYKEQLKKTG